MHIYDLTIIGAGPAGIMAAITASSRGARVALVEKNPQLGRKLLSTGNARLVELERERFQGPVALSGGVRGPATGHRVPDPGGELRQRGGGTGCETGTGSDHSEAFQSNISMSTGRHTPAT